MVRRPDVAQIDRLAVAARAEALLGLNVSGPVLQAWPALSTVPGTQVPLLTGNSPLLEFWNGTAFNVIEPVRAETVMLGEPQLTDVPTAATPQLNLAGEAL